MPANPTRVARLLLHFMNRPRGYNSYNTGKRVKKADITLQFFKAKGL
jgi:hypothetical protein